MENPKLSSEEIRNYVRDPEFRGKVREEYAKLFKKKPPEAWYKTAAKWTLTRGIPTLLLAKMFYGQNLSAAGSGALPVGITQIKHFNKLVAAGSVLQASGAVSGFHKAGILGAVQGYRHAGTKIGAAETVYHGAKGVWQSSRFGRHRREPQHRYPASAPAYARPRIEQHGGFSNELD